MGNHTIFSNYHFLKRIETETKPEIGFTVAAQIAAKRLKNSTKNPVR